MPVISPLMPVPKHHRNDACNNMMKYFICQITDNNEQLKYTTFGGLPVKHTLI